jgi:hypothetical protein
VDRFLRGERAGELAAGADAELGEDLPEVVGDGCGADELGQQMTFLLVTQCR